MGEARKYPTRPLYLESLEDRCVLSALPLLPTVSQLPLAELAQPITDTVQSTLQVLQPVADGIQALPSATGDAGLQLKSNIETPLLSTNAEIGLLASDSIASVNLGASVEPLSSASTSSLLDTRLGVEVGGTTQILGLDAAVSVLSSTDASSGDGLIDVAIGGQVGGDTGIKVGVDLGGGDSDGGSSGGVSGGVVDVGIDTPIGGTELGGGLPGASMDTTLPSLTDLIGGNPVSTGYAGNGLALAPSVIDGRLPGSSVSFVGAQDELYRSEGVPAEATDAELSDDLSISIGWLATDSGDLASLEFIGTQFLFRAVEGINEAVAVPEGGIHHELQLHQVEAMVAGIIGEDLGSLDAFFSKLVGAFESFRGWLARIGPMPWVMMAMALALTGLELASCYRRRVLLRKHASGESVANLDEMPVF